MQDVNVRLARAALEELLSWEELGRSPQLADFLRYIVEHSLDEREGTIKAYTIAVDVFSRDPNFDPQKDPIVRVQAARLRALLNKFYDSELNEVPLRISVPIGRYVPKFEMLPDRADVKPDQSGDNQVSAATESDNAPPLVQEVVFETADTDAVVATQSLEETTPPRHIRLPAFRVMLASALVVMIAVVGLVWFATLLWAPGGGRRPDVATRPVMPTLRVTGFENLTGLEYLAEPLEGLAQNLVTDLSRFEDFQVELGPQSMDVALVAQPSGSVYVLSGVARREGGEIFFDVLLTRLQSPTIFWTHTIQKPLASQDFSSLITQVSRSFSAALASHRGPLHSNSLKWAADHLEDFGEADPYICQLFNTLATDVATLAHLEAARTCFAQLRTERPDSAFAMAGWAGLTAKIERRNAALGASLGDELFDVTDAARLAVDLAPQSSFAHEQLARVLAAQNSSRQALYAYEAAIRLNHADMDVLAEYAQYLAFTGSLKGGYEVMELVLEESPAAPSWYYILRALQGLSDRDYETALANALIVTRSDPDLGMVLALSAAPLAARGDVVQRFIVPALGNKKFQSLGILPWVSKTVMDEDVLRLLEPGLSLAGAPSNAIWYPFEPIDLL